MNPARMGDTLRLRRPQRRAASFNRSDVSPDRIAS